MLSPKCMELEGEIKSLIKVWLSILASLCYCYFISSNIPKGIFRFLSLSPVLYLFTMLPLQLSTVLLFTFDLGPLSSISNPPKSLPLFLSFACLPIRITQKQTHPSNQNPSKFHLLLPIKALLFGFLLMVLNDHNYKEKQKVHPTFFIMGLYCSLIYLLLDVVLGLCNILINAVIGVELELPSDEPYLSTSLRDFWGRRWNLMVTYILRHTVYIPVRMLLSNTVLGPQWPPVLGIIASFLVSGLMHELLFYYVTRAPPTWEVTCFFVLHGVCVVVEIGVMKLLGQKRRGASSVWAYHGGVCGGNSCMAILSTAVA